MGQSNQQQAFRDGSDKNCQPLPKVPSGNMKEAGVENDLTRPLFN
jgi:hypothetical protein